MIVSMVVVMAANGVIGRDADLPWRLSTDLKRFKALTLGHPMVMGRTTWESFPRRPLPGRSNVVVTRNRDYVAPGAILLHDLDEAMKRAREMTGGYEICVIGGGQVFAELFDRTDRLYVTHIDEPVEGDTCFPAIEPDVWAVIHEEAVPAGPRDDFATRFVIYDRKVVQPGN